MVRDNVNSLFLCNPPVYAYRLQMLGIYVFLCSYMLYQYGFGHTVASAWSLTLFFTLSPILFFILFTSPRSGVGKGKDRLS